MKRINITDSKFCKKKNGNILPGFGLVTVVIGVGVVSVRLVATVPSVLVILVDCFSVIVVNGVGVIFVGLDEIVPSSVVISVVRFFFVVGKGVDVVFVG